MSHHNDLTQKARELANGTARSSARSSGEPEEEEEEGLAHSPRLEPLPGGALVELLVHSADLSNPLLPTFAVVRDWAVLVCEEFSAQVEAERAEGLPVAPHMAGLNTLLSIAKLQVGFIDYVVAPLWTALGSFLPELGSAVECMARNRATWKAIADGSAMEMEVKY
jgi:hypothetical protein